VVEVHPGMLADFGSSAEEVLGLLQHHGYRLRRLETTGELVEPGTFKAIYWILAE